MRRPLTALLVAAGLLLAAAPQASALTLFSTRPADGVEGEEVRNHTVAEFSDEGSCRPSDYSATIHWGDGDSPGVVGQREAVSGSCVYFVRGSHTYRRAGNYPLSVTVSGTGETAASAPATATIREAEFRGEALAIEATSGAPFAGQVAEIHDGNRLSEAGDFAATIDWGDGSTSPGTIAGRDGRFTVDGTHTYAAAGEYRVTVTVAHAGRSVVLDPATVRVAEGSAVPPGPVVAGESAEFRLRVLGAPLSVAAVRRRGLLLRLTRGGSTVRRARLELRRGRRVVQRSTITLPARGSTVRLRWRLSRRAARGLRSGRYSVRLRISGLPALQAAFRLRR